MAAARTLSWALGEPEARRIAEPALVRSGFVARREEQLRQIGGYGSPETLEEVREGFRTRNPAHSLRRFGRWLTDPDVDIPASEVAEGLTDLAQLDLEELLKVRSTTRSSLTLEETTAILARYAPKALGDWHRGFANVVAAQADDAVSLARNEIHDAFVLFDADTLRVLTAAKEKAAQTADTLGIKLGRIVSVAENAGGQMWSNEYFPNAMASQAAPATLGGALQPLTLDVTIGYELTRET